MMGILYYGCFIDDDDVEYGSGVFMAF